MPKVSVLLPSLNVSAYIDNCIKSVREQTISDIEIIAVDACSIDGTYEILQRHASDDPRIRVISSPKRSYGHQLNLALSNATGEYIAVVETDDYIEPNMMEVLSSNADKYALDYVKGYSNAFWSLKNGSSYIVENDRIPVGASSVFSPCDMPHLLLYEFHFWTGVYRRSFLEGIRFNETAGAAFQDIGFIIQTLIKAKRAMFVDQPVYWYKCNNEYSSVYNINGFQYLIDEYSFVPKVVNIKNKEWKNLIYLRWFMQTLERFRMMALSGDFWLGADKQIAFIRDKLANYISEYENIPFHLLSDESHALLRLFLISPKEVYDYFVEKYASLFSMAKRIEEWASGREVIVYGCGKLGRFLHAMLSLKCNAIVMAFADRDEKLWKNSVQGIPVFSPLEITKAFPDAYYLIAVKSDNETIRHYLMERGIKESHVYWEEVITDTFLLI